MKSVYRYRAKITSLIWQVLDLNFSQPNFLRAQDPFGHGVRASKKPYNAFLSSSAGLGSWLQFKTNVAIFWCWAQRQLRHTLSKTQWTDQAIQSWLRTHWNGLVWLFRNLWKNTEKSMTSSKPGPYYFEPNKKHLELPLSAWFIWLFLVGDTSFELVTPAVWKLLDFTIFLFKNNNLAVFECLEAV